MLRCNPKGASEKKLNLKLAVINKVSLGYFSTDSLGNGSDRLLEESVNLESSTVQGKF